MLWPEHSLPPIRFHHFAQVVATILRLSQQVTDIGRHEIRYTTPRKSWLETANLAFSGLSSQDGITPLALILLA
jgi:hypothetical protein